MESDHHCSTASTAAYKGHFECLKHLHSNSSEFGIGYMTAYNAAARGHLDCLVFACEVEPDLVHPKSVRLALQNNHEDCVKYLCDNGFVVSETQDRLIRDAVSLRRSEMLKYFWSKGYKYDQLCTLIAVKRGYLHGLSFLHKKGCPIEPETVREAIARGHTKIIEFMYRNKVEWSEPEIIHPNVKEYIEKIGDNWRNGIFDHK